VGEEGWDKGFCLGLALPREGLSELARLLQPIIEIASENSLGIVIEITTGTVIEIIVGRLGTPLIIVVETVSATEVVPVIEM